MRYSSYTIGIPQFSSIVKKLAIINVGIWFFLILILQQFFLENPYLFKVLGLVPSLFLNQGFIWQPFTYMFIHSSSLFHILFNMLILWMFGSELERLWGSKFFLTYYLVCGVGAALIYLLVLSVVSLFHPLGIINQTPVVGSSGAIFGLMLAYGVLFKDRVLYIMMIFPMKARTFIYLLVGIEIFSVLSSGLGGPVANLAHLGGLATGLLFLILWKNWSNIRAPKTMRRLRIVKTDDEKAKHKKTWH